MPHDPTAVALAIVSAGFLVSALVVIVGFAWLDRKPLTDTDEYCAAVDNALDGRPYETPLFAPSPFLAWTGPESGWTGQWGGTE